MNPLGGLMKVLLGGLLAWAFVSGALSKFTNQVTAAVGGAGAGSSAAPAAPSPGGGDSVA